MEYSQLQVPEMVDAVSEITKFLLINNIDKKIEIITEL